MQPDACSLPARQGHHRRAGFVRHLEPFLLPDGGGEPVRKPSLVQHHAFRKCTVGYSPEEAEEPKASLRLWLSFLPDVLKKERDATPVRRFVL